MIKRITNYELVRRRFPCEAGNRCRITNKEKLILFCALFIIQYSLFALSASAQGFWTPGQPIVPCGIGIQPDGSAVCPANVPAQNCQPCTKCDTLKLIRNIIDFVMIAAAPILATLFFIIAGVFLMLGGANPGMLATGKRIFKDTFIGLLIVMLTWLIVNTLVQSLTGSSSLTYCTFPGGNLNNGVCSDGSGRACTIDSDCAGNWWQFTCPFQ